MYRHLAAHFRASPAHLGAFPAMLHFGKTGAFLSAAVAYLRAQLAKLLRQLPIQAHHLHGSGTDRCTFQVQPDTLLHALHILFL
jgi:hypothetical protein